METKLCGKRMEQVRRSCDFQNGIEVAAEGTRGGLCMAWKVDINITLHSLSKRHIDVLVDDKEGRERWRYTGFYGTPYVQDRNESWEVLKSLIAVEDIPWFVCGDFNEIMYGFEKKGGLPRDEGRMEMFRNTLERARLNWLKFGDKNTVFFHSVATQRRRKNSIYKLQNVEGRDIELLHEMENVARSYFLNLFTTEGDGNNNHVLSGINCRIFEYDNLKLTAEYTNEEIRETVFEMATMKAPGEDGFPAMFY
ncbi:hypothetical protein J1N35_007351 [Gossypium stocksii]|uniref:Reverse transcriptase n=1 Tax=Gossypium stocksii TaxID=47602 RepID=A0A9D3W8C5_9ROSI|nr:hypothetical protein J1N35_007351 [Gossypium stocksii]